MKHIFIGVCALIVSAMCLSGCDEERTLYSGPDYVMFSDTLSTFAVQNSTDYYNVYVSTMQACDYDRTFGIEVVTKESNAIEGVNYTIKSNSVVVKAGERSAALRLRAIYDSFEDTDSIGVTFKLVNKDKIWDAYGDKTRVILRKVCPYNLETFTGYCRVKSTYFEQYMMGTDYRLINTIVDPENENTIIMRNFFYNGRDIRLKLSDKKPLEPAVLADEQILTTTGEAFQTIWGDDQLRMQTPIGANSYFNVCQHFMVHYMVLYVENVGSVGTFVNAIEWISQNEARVMLRERSTSNGLPEDDPLNNPDKDDELNRK